MEDAMDALSISTVSTQLWGSTLTAYTWDRCTLLPSAFKWLIHMGPYVLFAFVKRSLGNVIYVVELDQG